MSKLIVVCGLPGAGKTTLVKKLSKELKIFCLQKDFFKESLYESMNCSTLEDSVMLGRPSVNLVFQIAEEAIKNDVDIMIEGVFSFNEDIELLKKWEEKYNLSVFTIICSINEKDRRERFDERMKKDRHKAHHDEERREVGKPNYFENCAFPKDFDYEKMPGKKIKIITDKPVEELIERIKKEIN